MHGGGGGEWRQQHTTTHNIMKDAAEGLVANSHISQKSSAPGPAEFLSWWSHLWNAGLALSGMLRR